MNSPEIGEKKVFLVKNIKHRYRRRINNIYVFAIRYLLGQGGPDPNTSPQRGVCPPHYCPHPKITYARYLCTKYETRCRNDLPHVSHANGRSPE